MNALRKAKLESLILQLITKLISQERIKDHRVGNHLSITNVTMNKDGTFANITISSLKGESYRSKGTEGLNSAAGFIRRELAPKLFLRKIPTFRFYEDKDVARQIINQELKPFLQ